ncbi:MAG: winged helix-turn-helix transcriptional regulator [Thermodesulfobacteriota bacterium]
MQKEDLHILRLMGEIDRRESYSQRELSRSLDISLGLVNTFLKRLVKKGYFKVKTMPRNRVKYFLTPEGLARKSRLTAEYLRYSLNFYRDIKLLLVNKYSEMEKSNVKAVLFCGAGEVADLAYLYLQLSSVRLAGIVDEKQQGKNFFGFRISGYERLEQQDWDVILLTRLEDTEKTVSLLLDKGVNQDRITTI